MTPKYMETRRTVEEQNISLHVMCVVLSQIYIYIYIYIYMHLYLYIYIFAFVFKFSLYAMRKS